MKYTNIFLAALLAATPFAAVAQQVATIEPGALALHSADNYRKAARYPESNQILAKGHVDPIRSEATPEAITVRHRVEGEALPAALSIWSGKMSFQPGEPVTFFAKGLDGELTSVSGVVVNEAGDTVGRLDLFDDGGSYDKASSDGVWSGQAALAKAFTTPELAEVYRVKLSGTFADGTVQHAVGGFVLSNPWSRLTGNYRDAIVDGNLVIGAEIEVTQGGRFHLAGTLYDLNGEPVGTAQTAASLKPGVHWVDLSWYGLLLRDRKAFGPYTLGSLQMRTTGGMPNAFNDLVEDAYTTSFLPMKSLNTVPFGQHSLLETADVLEAEAAEARGWAAMPKAMDFD